MATYEEDLRFQFGNMSTEELAIRFQSGLLTDEGKQLAEAELSKRGISAIEAKAIEVSVAQQKVRRKYRFIDAQNGQMPLWMAFWGGFVLIYVVFFAVHVYSLLEIGGDRFVFVVALVAHSWYWALCVSRCAKNIDKNLFLGNVAIFITGVNALMMPLSGLANLFF